MTRDDIIRMAREAGFVDASFCRWKAYSDDLERFADLVAAAELRRLAAVEAQRDALLEALKRAADFLHHATEFRIGHPGFEQTHAKARAAIKAVEEGK